MSILYDADEAELIKILMNHGTLDSGHYVTGKFDELMFDLRRYCSRLRPEPQRPTFRPKIPLLTPTDVFYTMGKGTGVAISMAHEDVEGIRVFDHVMFNAEAYAIADKPHRDKIETGMVYRVSSIEVPYRVVTSVSQANTDGVVLFVGKPIGREAGEL